MNFLRQNQNTSRLVSLEEIPQLQKSHVYLIDLRQREAFQQFHIPGFISGPINEINDWIKQCHPAIPIYLICEHGQTAYETANMLYQAGFDAYAFYGGIQLYQASQMAYLAYF